jgi:hypothetical protein
VRDPSGSGASSGPTTSAAQRSEHPDVADEIDDEGGRHEDAHRAAQATLEHSAGPEGEDPVDDMETESRPVEADGER